MRDGQRGTTRHRAHVVFPSGVQTQPFGRSTTFPRRSVDAVAPQGQRQS
jgi:hypothetical protein